MECVCSTLAEIHSVSSLALDSFVQHILRCFLCTFWHGRRLINTCRGTCCFFAGTLGIRSALIEIYFVPWLQQRGLVDTSSVPFSLLTDMGFVRSRQVEVHYMGMVNTCRDAFFVLSVFCKRFRDSFCVLAGMGED